jgi:RNA-directed DNA polymerase
MENAIRAAIERQAKKLIERHKKLGFVKKKYERRFRLRTGLKAIPSKVRDPGMWEVAPHFDPIYCIKHSKYLAKTIWRKITERKYEPNPAVLFKIPKDSGGYREIMVFTIPDAAVANLFNSRMRDRNRNIQSPFCYSYRKDRTLFDAVLHTSSLLAARKCYVVQYDFSKYFDSIKHEYLKFVLDKNEFSVAPAERCVIAAFLSHRFATLNDYKNGVFEKREVGVPQGSSLSLFLSNIAAHELDKELERSNGSFVRFADDIVCVTHSYGDALRVASAFERHCHYSGIKINHEKSPGICLIKGASPSIQRDFFIDDGDIGKVETIEQFDYIGHKFSSGSVGISSRGIKRIKTKLARVIYIHLLHNLKRDMFDSKRIGGQHHDWDLVTCINELRSYVYGGLRETQLTNFIDLNIRIGRFKGLMSFYPLVTHVEQLSMLDGWLVSALRRATRERRRLIAEKFKMAVPSLTESELIGGHWYKFQNGIELETGAPSFVLAWRAARKAFRQYGLSDFASPNYYSTVFQGYDG